MSKLSDHLKKIRTKKYQNRRLKDHKGKNVKDIIFKEKNKSFKNPETLTDYFEYIDKLLKVKRGRYFYEDIHSVSDEIAPIVPYRDFGKIIKKVFGIDLNKLIKDYSIVKPLFKFYVSDYAFYQYEGDVNHYEEDSFPYVKKVYHHDECAIIVEWLVETRVTKRVSYTTLVNQLIEMRIKVREHYERLRITRRYSGLPRICKYWKRKYSPKGDRLNFYEYL